MHTIGTLLCKDGNMNDFLFWCRHLLVSLLFPYIPLHFPTLYIQWNLRIKDKLVHQPMSTIRRLSFIGEFLPKILHFIFLSAAYPLFYIL